ncbi:hypothetical protein [Flavobacterium sp.]|jgi:hypothetical protein|uniref:hypothetical protein n=1 Tax=Flavobacterium sp. TaxID=239 RepID=UPI0038FC10A2
MKSIKKILLAAVILFSVQMFSQTQPSVYAVVSKAKWCPTCVKNDARVGSEVMSKIDMTKVTVLVNDLSDKETKIVSAETLKANGLENLKLKSTGVISFINVKTKKVISTISVSKSSEEILKAFSDASSM